MKRKCKAIIEDDSMIQQYFLHVRWKLKTAAELDSLRETVPALLLQPSKQEKP